MTERACIKFDSSTMNFPLFKVIVNDEISQTPQDITHFQISESYRTSMVRHSSLWNL